MELNPEKRELSLKVVYYGPALSGKTTNLRALHECCDPAGRGRLMTLDTADDRTLFFDLFPLLLRTSGGVKVKVKLFTVPGQVMHNSTRRLVLAACDAVAFIADAQPQARQANFDYWRNLGENLKENGLDAQELPLVIQFNKVDLVGESEKREMADVARALRHPVHFAAAIRGEGVKETFLALLDHAFDRLDRKHELGHRMGLTKAGFLELVRRTFVPPPPGGAS